MITEKNLSELTLEDLNTQRGIVVHPADEPFVKDMYDDLIRKTEAGVAFRVLSPGSDTPLLASLARSAAQMRGRIKFCDTLAEWKEEFSKEPPTFQGLEKDVNPLLYQAKQEGRSPASVTFYVTIDGQERIYETHYPPREAINRWLDDLYRMSLDNIAPGVHEFTAQIRAEIKK